MKIKVYGGPEDGAEVETVQPLAQYIVEGKPFTFPPEAKAEFTMGQKFYRYRLHQSSSGLYHYDYVGEFIREFSASTEGGEQHAVEEARGGGDSPGPE